MSAEIYDDNVKLGQSFSTPAGLGQLYQAPRTQGCDLRTYIKDRIRALEQPQAFGAETGKASFDKPLLTRNRERYKEHCLFMPEGFSF